MKRCALSALAMSVVLFRGADSHAGDGSNDACSAQAADADDVRESYDSAGRLLHQLRLRGGRVAQEVAVSYDEAGHPVERTESIAGTQRIARTRWAGDNVGYAECLIDGRVVATAAYTYDGDRLVSKRETSDGQPTRITTIRYDALGHPVGGETRTDGAVTYRWQADRALPVTPIKILLTGGGSYQSDTRLLDASAGLGVHRRPEAFRFGGDPLEVALDGNMRFHRAEGVTSTDQTHARLGVDYNLVLPHTTLFTFTAVDRNLPANLKLNLEEGFLGIKYDVTLGSKVIVDASFAPVWTLRAIIAPPPTASGSPPSDEITSTLRGSLRLRASYGSPAVNITEVLEFLPALYGDDVPSNARIGDRSILRNSVALELAVAPQLKFRQEVRYTRDPSLKAQASCPDSQNPLCSGYTVATLTSLTLALDIGH